MKGEIETDQVLGALNLTEVHLGEEGHLLAGHRFSRHNVAERAMQMVVRADAVAGWEGILLTSPN